MQKTTKQGLQAPENAPLILCSAEESLILTDLEIGYIAGIIDGEGWLGLVNRTDRRNKKNINCQTYLMIGNTNKKVLDWLVKITKLGNISKPYDSEIKLSSNRKPHWLLRFSPNDMRLLLPRIIPYLVIKKRQAEIIIEYLNMTFKGKHRTEEEYTIIMRLYDEIKQLNRKGRSQ